MCVCVCSRVCVCLWCSVYCVYSREKSQRQIAIIPPPPPPTSRNGFTSLVRTFNREFAISKILHATVDIHFTDEHGLFVYVFLYACHCELLPNDGSLTIVDIHGWCVSTHTHTHTHTHKYAYTYKHPYTHKTRIRIKKKSHTQTHTHTDKHTHVGREREREIT